MLAITPLDMGMLALACAVFVAFVAVMLWATVSSKRDADRRLRAVFDNFSQALAKAGAAKRRQLEGGEENVR